jgi:PAS domain S-box-containing protein
VPIVDARGNYCGYRGFDRDITERKESEAALRSSRLRLSAAAELAHLVYWEYDTQTGVLLLNDPYYAFHGTTAEQEGGYQMTNEEYANRFVHPDDRVHFFQVIEQNKARRDVEFVADLEHRIVRRDGDVRHVLTRTRVIQDSPDSPARVYGANQDITERKQAEQERERLISTLTETLSQVKILSGLLPVCASCRKIRNDAGDWELMEEYVRKHSEAKFSHGICPECARRLYPDYNLEG